MKSALITVTLPVPFGSFCYLDSFKCKFLISGDCVLFGSPIHDNKKCQECQAKHDKKEII